MKELCREDDRDEFVLRVTGQEYRVIKRAVEQYREGLAISEDHERAMLQITVPKGAQEIDVVLRGQPVTFHRLNLVARTQDHEWVVFH